MLNRYAFHIVFVVFTLVVGTMLWRWHESSIEREVVERELFAPYFAAISEGRFADAYLRHSASWQQRFDLAAFSGHYQKLLADDGPIVTRSVFNSNAFYEPGNGAGLNVDYQVTFKKEMIAISFHLLPGPDKALQIASAASTSRNLRYEALPW